MLSFNGTMHEITYKIIAFFIYLIILIFSNHILEARGNEYGTSKEHKDIHILKVNPEPPYCTALYVYHHKIPFAPIQMYLYRMFV